VCICLGNPLGSHLEARVQQLGVPLYFLGKGDKMSFEVLRKLDALFRQYRPAVVHTHLLALNYAYPLMIRYRTPARLYTVHNLAEKDLGLRTAPIVRMRWRFVIVLAGLCPLLLRKKFAPVFKALWLPRPAADPQRHSNRRVRAQPQQAHPVAPSTQHRAARDSIDAHRTVRHSKKPRAAD
jgi:hypothetical protein